MDTAPYLNTQSRLLLTFRLGQDRLHLDNTLWPIPGCRLFFQKPIDLRLLDHIVLVVGPVGSRYQSFGDPSAIYPDGRRSFGCCGACRFVVDWNHLHGRQHIESLRSWLHPGCRCFGGRILRTEAAHRQPNTGRGTPRPEQHLLVVSETPSQKALTVWHCVVAIIDSHARKHASVPNGIQLELLLAILDGVPFF